MHNAGIIGNRLELWGVAKRALIRNYATRVLNMAENVPCSSSLSCLTVFPNSYIDYTQCTSRLQLCCSIMYKVMSTSCFFINCCTAE